MRLDQYISTAYGFTRNKSQHLIKNGLISIKEKVVIKPSFEVSWEEQIDLKEDRSIAWVSRSAGKLDGLLESLEWANIGIHIDGAHCLDIGSSTGGFTQVLLERWARHVDAVDVGTDQLHASIKNNLKVSSYEQTDVRKLATPREPYRIITIDVSFISLTEILTELSRFSDENTEIFLLFKPQFEVGRENLRKTWVPKSEKIIEQALIEFVRSLQSMEYKVLYQEKASVIGEAGNQEYMFFVKKRKNTLDI